MATDKQINANRRNALLSTGPKSPESRAKSARNSRKHGLRSEREKLAREESIAFEGRYFRWAANYGVETDPEEFLLNANLFVASDMDRVRGAYLELTQSQVDDADDDEIKEVRETGDRLFSDPRGVPVSMYGNRRFNGMKPGGPSWGSAKAPALSPGELMGKLESSAMGCYWILEILEELLKLARESFWVGGDRLRMIRLLRRNPVEAVADRRVAEIFAASHALRPVDEAFAELESDMSELAAENQEQDIRARWRDLSRKGEPEKARQSLIDLVEGEIERVWAIAEQYDENAGDEAARTRRRKGFVHTKEADAMRRYFLRAKGSVERGGKVLRQEVRARKADKDAEKLPPVPGKDISPYDGRPAAWWREKPEEGRSAALREPRDDLGGGRGQADVAQDGYAVEGDCGSGGLLAAGGSDAAVEIDREGQAGGTRFDSAHHERSVPATSNEKRRGWDSVVVEESDILACGGYLPERYAGATSDEGHEDEAPAALEDEVPNLETASSESEEVGTCDTDLNAEGVSEGTQEGLAEDVDRAREDGGDAGGDEGQTCQIAPNEANFCDDVCIAQPQDIIEVPTSFGGVSGLEGCQAKPFFLETKPIPEGDAEAGGVGDSTKPGGRTLTERERRDAWMEIARREWIRSRAEKEARERERERERLARLNSGATNTGTTSLSAGDGEPLHDVRGP